jgi:hypothetical protein
MSSYAKVKLAIDKRREQAYVEDMYEQWLLWKDHQESKANAANMVGEVLGGIVGFAAGGPSGAKLGASIGSSVSGYAETYDDYKDAKAYMETLSDTPLKFYGGDFKEILETDLTEYEKQVKNYNKAYLSDLAYSALTTDYGSFESGSTSLNRMFGSGNPNVVTNLRGETVVYDKPVPVRKAISMGKNLFGDLMTPGSRSQAMITDFAERNVLKRAIQDGNLNELLGELIGEHLFKEFI